MPTPYSRSNAAMVAKIVTIMLRIVVVEQPHPSAFVRSSNLSLFKGHTFAFDTGSRSDDAGMHVEEYGHHPQPLSEWIQL
jgi:hypothetical protein